MKSLSLRQTLFFAIILKNYTEPPKNDIFETKNSIMSGLIHAHSGFRYLVLLLLIVAVVNAAMKYKSNSYTKKDKLIDLFAMIFLHIQLVLGLVLYFWNLSANKFVRFSSDIFDPINHTIRYFTIDHAFGMLVAITIVTIGRSKAKKIEDPAKKHRKIFWWYLVGLLIILASIPWPFYGVGTGWA